MSIIDSFNKAVEAGKETKYVLSRVELNDETFIVVSGKFMYSETSGLRVEHSFASEGLGEYKLIAGSDTREAKIEVLARLALSMRMSFKTLSSYIAALLVTTGFSGSRVEYAQEGMEITVYLLTLIHNHPLGVFYVNELTTQIQEMGAEIKSSLQQPKPTIH